MCSTLSKVKRNTLGVLCPWQNLNLVNSQPWLLLRVSLSKVWFCMSISREYLLHFFNASTVRSGSPHTLLSSSCHVRRSRTAWERTLRRPRLIASICEWKIDKRDEITQERGRKQVRLFRPLNKVNKVSWQLYTNKAFSHALSLWIKGVRNDKFHSEEFAKGKTNVSKSDQQECHIKLSNNNVFKWHDVRCKIHVARGSFSSCQD